MIHNDEKELQLGNSRRSFLKRSAALTAVAVIPAAVDSAAKNRLDEKYAYQLEQIPVSMEINGVQKNLAVDPRTTLLDLLREELHMTGTKKGCDHGQCGACTVHVNGHRINSCLTLAVMQQGNKITTIEGLANGDELHPMQKAFIKCDGFQCGYCTPGQIMSAIGCVNEGHTKNEEEIREFMSGNLCRCGAYNGIANAIKEIAK
ncbi:2Fe-2S iron-sulfur cluster-binding protein [Ferruginibacter sp.]